MIPVSSINECPPLSIAKTQTLSPAVDIPVIESAPRSEAVSGPPSVLSRALWPATLLGAIILALYFKIGVKLVHDWINIPDYSHGLLIPFFVAFLIWDQRRTLLSTPLKPSWFGLRWLGSVCSSFWSGFLAPTCFYRARHFYCWLPE